MAERQWPIMTRDAAAEPPLGRSTPELPPLALWGRWVVANAVGELLGLGVVAVVGFGLARRMGEPQGVLPVVGFAFSMVALGGYEGAAVGYAQWRVLRRPLGELTARSWVGATVAGALAAWLLGMLPSTIMSLIAEPGGPPPEMAGALAALLAALLGAVAGVVLALFQWWVLRRFVHRAGWWLAANALAWACGMPLVFAAAGAVPEGAAPGLVMAAILLTLAAAGAVVGAVHGVALVVLLRTGRR